MEQQKINDDIYKRLTDLTIKMQIIMKEREQKELDRYIKIINDYILYNKLWETNPIFNVFKDLNEKYVCKKSDDEYYFLKGDKDEINNKLIFIYTRLGLMEDSIKKKIKEKYGFDFMFDLMNSLPNDRIYNDMYYKEWQNI